MYFPLKFYITKSHYELKLNLCPLRTKEEILINYSEIIMYNRIEDVVLLHLMFNLRLTPFAICLLTYESLTELKSWNTLNTE